MSYVNSLLLASSLSVLFYEIIFYIQRKRSMGYKRLKSFQKEIEQREHILDKLGNIIMPLIQRVPKKEKIERFILQAGSPYNLTYKRYSVVKIVMAIALYFVLAPESLGTKILFPLIGFFGLDIVIFAKRRQRQQQIITELPFMLTKIARSTANGIPLREILTVLASRLQGPLQDEVKRLSAHYNIDGNLTSCLPVFADRIGMDEVDNMAMAMIQAEQSGKMRSILEKQADILKRRENFKSIKGTKNRSNFLPLTTVGMVICIFLLVAVPMFLLVATNGLFG